MQRSVMVVAEIILERIEERIKEAIIRVRLMGVKDDFDKGYIQGLYRALDIIEEERGGANGSLICRDY